MATIQIDIDEIGSKYILSGDITLLSENRRARLYFDGYLSADFSTEDKINVPYEEATKEKTLAGIRSALSKFDIGEVRSDRIQKELELYFNEEERFSEFSKRAKDIRNNKYDVAEFAAFAESLKINMPNRRLYEHQMLSAYHLAFSQNACNFSVPGAGKTSVVYGAYTYLKNLPQADPKHVDKIFIIGPLSSFLAWEDEYKACYGVEADSKRLSGGTSAANRVRHLYTDNPSEISLISYQGLPSSLEDVIFFLKKHKVMVVLDEAHKIKNIEGGMWAESVAKISRYCKARVVLTGTPVPNGFQDLNNLFTFLYPDKNVIGIKLYQLKDLSEDDSRVQELIDNISPFFIRVKKNDLSLPAPIEHPPVLVPMGAAQREIYDFIDKAYLPSLKSLQKEDSTNSLVGMMSKAKLIRLMQTATNPSLLQKPIGQFYDEQGMLDDVFIDDTAVLKKILSYQEMEVPSKFMEAGKIAKRIVDEGGRAIIWASFVDNIKQLQNHLDSIGIKSELLFGETPVESEGQDETLRTREKIIREFHEESCTFRVVIANPFAVAESISLHKVCHNAIYLERSYNASHFLQSKDRIHRVGLKPTDVTNYYYLVSENSIDETIHEALAAKEKRMMKLIESEEIPLISLNMDYETDSESDFKSIIRAYVARRA